jgi:hypothetical protein
LGRNGIIKTIIIIFLTSLSVLNGSGPNTHYPILIAIVPPFIFGLVLSLFGGIIGYFINQGASSRPNWNDSLLSIRKPLSIMQFLGILLVSIGVSLQFFQWFKNNDFSQVGVLLGTLGCGLISGIWLIILIRKITGNENR